MALRATYTVKAGDKVLDLNKNQLTDPDKIKPGQALRRP